MLDDFNVISAQHLERLLGGELLATGPRLDWATLLRRTFGLNLKNCPVCGDKMKPIAVITEPNTVRRILDHLAQKQCSSARASA